ERALEWVGWYVSALGPPHAHAPISEPWRVRWYALVARDRARAGCPGPRRPTGTCPLRSPTAGSGSGTPASFHESFSHDPDRGSAIVPDVGLVQTHLDGPRALHGAGATNVSGHLLVVVVHIALVLDAEPVGRPLEVRTGLTLLMLTPELAGRADLREGCPYGKAEKVHAG